MAAKNQTSKKINIKYVERKQSDYQCNKNREEYGILCGGAEKWKECKVLGNLLDTEYDIETRHDLAASTYKKVEKVFKNSSANQEMKLKVFIAFLGTSFYTTESCGHS